MEPWNGLAVRLRQSWTSCPCTFQFVVVVHVFYGECFVATFSKDLKSVKVKSLLLIRTRRATVDYIFQLSHQISGTWKENSSPWCLDTKKILVSRLVVKPEFTAQLSSSHHRPEEPFCLFSPDSWRLEHTCKMVSLLDSGDIQRPQKSLSARQNVVSSSKLLDLEAVCENNNKERVVLNRSPQSLVVSPSLADKRLLEKRRRTEKQNRKSLTSSPRCTVSTS